MIQILCRAMAQAVSRWPLITKTRFRARFSPYEICGGQSVTGTGFSPSSSVFPYKYHSRVALHAHISSERWTVGPLVAAAQQQ
jgi:hypothetical protein